MPKSKLKLELKFFKRRSAGSATVMNIGIIGAVFIIFAGCLAFAMLSLANAKLVTALENASIAGAMYYKTTGWEPCAVVRQTLEINQADFVSCRVLENKNVEVEASRNAFGPQGFIGTIYHYTRAGQSLVCNIF
ncbi:MAG: flp pilus-assembly TadE/G-like family protein [Bifidobacteriaceae bacterium]|jgi:hypothetical protein|nr:flp pilus-assembly TadE/G-like family protein [Bifidobacteriaceae bacterium]